MDIVTMLEFIILVGTVVNNAILIVHQNLSQKTDFERVPVNLWFDSMMVVW